MASHGALVVLAVMAAAGTISPAASRPQQTSPGHSSPPGHAHGHIHAPRPIQPLPPVHAIGVAPHGTANAFLQGFNAGQGTVVAQPPSIEILPNGQRVVQPVSIEVGFGHGPQPISYEILPDGTRVVAPISLEVGVHGRPGVVPGAPAVHPGQFHAPQQPPVYPGAPQTSFQQQPNFQQVYPGAPNPGFQQGHHTGAAGPNIDVRGRGTGNKGH